MKVRNISSAMAFFLAAFSISAQAVMLNPKGLGQVLIYPYYTVNKSQDTYVSVVNTSDVGKVVAVRFLESDNGRTVLGFTLYLSAHDVWTAAVSAPDATPTSGARLTSSDKSCIDPLLSFPAPFSTRSFDGTVAGWPVDGGDTTTRRTREGHIEMIALADIIPGSATDLATTHVQNGQSNGGVPSGCGHLPTTLAADTVAPTSGLFGSGAIINVGEGMFYPYIADALTGFTDTSLLAAHSSPDGVSLADAHTSDSATPHGATATVFTDKGRALTLDYARGIDAVSAVFMTDSLANEYLTDANLGANTDWVVTLPTKRFYVDKALYPDPQTDPFVLEQGYSWLGFENVGYDREENWGGYPRCPMPPCFDTAFEIETNVVGFRPWPSGVLGGFGSISIPAPSNVGWLKLGIGWFHLPGGQTANHSAITLNGLPATGFMVYNIINSNAQPGRLANYGGLFAHRTHLSCTSAAPGAPGDPCS